MKDLISKLAFSDETEQFRSPSEPNVNDKVCIKIRVEKNKAKSVRLLLLKERDSVKMHRMQADRYFDIYRVVIKCKDTKVSYAFMIELEEGGYLLYQKNGSFKKDRFEMPQDSRFAFSFIPGFHVPEWSKGVIQYQIMPDRFRNGDKTNDVEDKEYYYINGHSKRLKWDTPIYGSDFRHFYGGDLKGIYEKLDYLQDLGVESIYLNPIFVSPSSHKYDTQDYMHVDPHLGVVVEDKKYRMHDWEHHNGYAQEYIKRVISQKNLEESDRLFARLCREIHKRGMKIIIDGVFNHCGSFNKWMDKEGVYAEKPGYKLGAARGIESHYREYFKFEEKEGDFCAEYDSWWGMDTLPKLNYENSRKLQEKIFSIAEKWSSPPYSIDGWRLDVAADLGYSQEFNHKFWKKFRKRVKAVNKDIVIIAEHYGDASSWLQGDEWDTVMNYDAFMEPLSFFLTGMEKHSDYYDHELYQNGKAFFDSMREKMSTMQITTLMCSMNELSNHDHSRFMTRTNKRVGRLNTVGSDAAGQCLRKEIFREAVVVQMTWPGAPTIYYADEAGQVGWTDPDCRRTYPWGREDKELIRLHKELIAIRKAHPVFTKGSIIEIAADYGLIVYGRFTKDECAVVAVNNARETRLQKIDVVRAGAKDSDVFEQIFSTEFSGHSSKRKTLKPVHGRKLEIEIPPRSALILIRK